MSKKELSGAVVFGWYKVGKTALISKFIDGAFNEDEYRPTGFVQLYTKHGYQYPPRWVSNADQEPMPEVGATRGDGSVPDAEQTYRLKELDAHSKMQPQSQSQFEAVDYTILEATDTGCIVERRDWVYAKMTAIILAYAITDPMSFQIARDILSRARGRESEAKIFLVGMLADCEQECRVSLEQGEELAKEFGVDFRELSPLRDADGVDRLFGEVAGFLVLGEKQDKVKASSGSRGGGGGAGLTVRERIKGFIPWPPIQT
ncbi:hypothetical protein BJX68DRAFT_271894 [Aspergillus pseudodeflectus]|uniref:small monomeric GTPase n=1 Tax=Aspergillus pseudodeflectus TaxID=176178 RepID=A0ABR4JIF9_9EURO